MLKKIADNRDQRSLAVQLRKKRFAFFEALLSPLARPIHILDIGGTELYWKVMDFHGDGGIFITLLNTTEENVTVPNMTSIVGDARKIKAENASYDVVFSNSVIEHVGTYQDQLKMAEEVRRVGKRYFIQTPNKYFPFEPHFLFPFFQFLPLKTRLLLVQNFDLGWFKRISDPIEAREVVEGIRLLNRKELSTLFPTGSIYCERVLGLTKSFVAYEGWDK